MQNPKRERWQILCEQASVEQNPEKFLLLIRELDEALKAREEQLKAQHKLRARKVRQETSDAQA